MIQVKNKKNCCGCTACASICKNGAISMQLDEEGFLYPVCELSLCTNCHLCEKVCPIIEQDIRQPNTMPIKIFALYNKDEKILRTSSSGGVFAVLTKYFLSKNGIIYGAEFNEHLIVIHRGETTPEGALRFRGSKYVQSNICGIYEEIKIMLQNGKIVLFSGTPCQVAGLKGFLRKPYSNLFTVDILCHGVPSPKVFADYVNYVNRFSIGRLQKIFMKDKTFGWGYQNLRLTFSNGLVQFNTVLSNLWNKIFYSYWAIRPSCYACRFTNYSRSGDFSIGDFWGIENSHPNFKNPNGVSLLLVNTKQGEIIWSQIKSHFEFVESTPKKCAQQSLLHPVTAPVNRNIFWRTYMIHGLGKVAKLNYGISLKKLITNYIHQLRIINKM